MAVTSINTTKPMERAGILAERIGRLASILSERILAGRLDEEGLQDESLCHTIVDTAAELEQIVDAENLKPERA